MYESPILFLNALDTKLSKWSVCSKMEVELVWKVGHLNYLTFQQLGAWMASRKQKLVCKARQFERPLMLQLQENHLPNKNQVPQLMCLIGEVSKPADVN